MVVAVGPQDADAAEVLFEVIGAPHVRASEESQSAGVGLERLVDGEFHREISDAL